MTHIFVVTEISVFRLMLYAALGRNILILGVEPLLPFSGIVLQKIVALIIRTGRAMPAIDTVPELDRVKKTPRRTLLYDVFGRIEAWQNEYFRFPDAERILGDYAMAYKMAVTNHVSMKHVSLLVLDALFGKAAENSYTCIGFPADTRAAAEDFCGAPLPCAASWVPSRLINFVQFAIVTLVAVLWIVFHLRLRKTDPKPIFFAADFINDKRDFRLYRELEDGGDLLMVNRREYKDSPRADELSRYAFCDRDDGHLNIEDLLPMLKMILGDEWRIHRRFNKLNPVLFKRLLSLPYRRLLYRGLFLRFRPKFFWGRDPYNEDHIIRRQELNRVGGRSWGVNTGALTWSTLIPEYRYVNYDRYYVFGRGKYEKYYGDTWAKDMDVVPSGTFTAQREHYAKRFETRPHDIAVFVSVFLGEPEMVEFVRGLAEAFPDRTIILQVKANFNDTPGMQGFIDACRKDLANVEYSRLPAYDIFFLARYGISDPSSIVLEAMQLGMISFAFDLPHLQRTNVNRAYPGLTVGSAEEAIGRIRAIESGSWLYPIETFQDVVDLSGMVFFDRVRTDMGLPAKEASIPLLKSRDLRTLG